MKGTRNQSNTEARSISVLLVTIVLVATFATASLPVNAGPLDRDLTLNGPTGVIPGEAAIFEGRLTHTDSSVGLPLQAIEIRMNGVPVATATTDGAGTYSIELEFPEEGTFNLVARAYTGTPLMVESAPWSVSVRNVVLLNLSGPTQVEPGQTTTFSGSLTMNGDALAFEQIEILRLGAVVASTTTNAAGMYSASVAFPEGGIFQLTAQAFSGTLDMVTSKPHTVRVGADLGPFASVEGGMTGGCGLLFNGTVYCWGDNRRGHVGDGTNEMRDHPVKVKNLTDVTAITVGDQTNCAVRSDGTAWCWGQNHQGQLGDGTTTERNAPVKVVGLTDVVAISTKIWHTCALKSDGTAWCWGQNNQGQLGNGERTESWEYGSLVPTQVLGPDGEGFLTDVTSIATGFWHTCATTDIGTSYCWGANPAGQIGNGESNSITEKVYTTPEQVVGLTNAVQISAGHLHTCAVTVDGIPYCWGYGASGRLGNGGTWSELIPKQVLDLVNVTTIVAAASSHSCALRNDGTAWCWGSGSHGKLGIGVTQGHFPTPQQVGLSIDATSIGTVGENTCSAAVDGNAWCWGMYSRGSLGNGNSPPPGMFNQNKWPLQVITPAQD